MENDVLRNTLWERRCEKDVVRKTLWKDVVRNTLWERRYKKDVVRKTWDRREKDVPSTDSNLIFYVFQFSTAVKVAEDLISLSQMTLVLRVFIKHMKYNDQI